MGKCPLFWNLKTDRQSDIQASLMLYQWENYREKLEIPAPPGSSQGVWLTVQLETSEEIDKLMRQRPKSPKRVK